MNEKSKSFELEREKFEEILGIPLLKMLRHRVDKKIFRLILEGLGKSSQFCA